MTTITCNVIKNQGLYFLYSERLSDKKEVAAKNKKALAAKKQYEATGVWTLHG